MAQFLLTRTRLMALCCTTALFAAAPLTLTRDAASGLVSLGASVALAKNGSDDGPGPGAGNATVVRIERSAAGIEVTVRDGSRIVVENGRYERKSANGRTVEERPALSADMDRLLALR